MLCVCNENELQENANTQCVNTEEQLETQAENCLEIQKPIDQTPTKKEDEESEEAKKLGDEILKLSILGLTFGGSWVLTIMGFIFSGIAKKKIKQYKAKFGKLRGRAKAGKTVSTIGTIVIWVPVICIALLVVFLIYSIVSLVKGI